MTAAGIRKREGATKIIHHLLQEADHIWGTYFCVLPLQSLPSANVPAEKGDIEAILWKATGRCYPNHFSKSMFQEYRSERAPNLKDGKIVARKWLLARRCYFHSLSHRYARNIIVVNKYLIMRYYSSYYFLPGKLLFLYDSQCYQTSDFFEKN